MSLVRPPATDPAETLLVQWRSHGDGRALAALFDRTAPDLFRIALSVAPDAATAEEAVQETFLALLEDPHACDASQPIMPWLVGVLRHKVLDARRRARRVPDPLRLEPRLLPEDPADGAVRQETIDRVRAALNDLPEPYRSVALLRWEYGLEPGEIAHARGEPPGTVRSTLSRALQRLRKKIGGAGALALVLGVRPPDGLAAIRRTVLAKAGFPAGATAAGVVVGGILVGKFAAMAIVTAAFAAGGLAGAAVVTAIGPAAPPERAPVAAAPLQAADAAVDDTTLPMRPPVRRVVVRRADASDPVDTDAAPGQPPLPEALAKQSGTRKTHAALESLDGTWATAWKVGQDLARLTPAQAVLDVLRERWPHLPDPTDRQNLLKGFDYDSASDIRLDVFDLGANDPDPRVRWFALSYLEPYAGRRLVDSPDAWRTWQAEAAGKSPVELLETAVDQLLLQLRFVPPDEREDALGLLSDALVRRDAAAPPRDDVFLAASAWLEDSDWLGSLRPLVRVVAAARPPDDRSRGLFTSLLRDGPAGERRAFLLAGQLGARWAVDTIVPRLRSGSADVVVAAADALGDIGDPRAFGPLVEALSEHAGEPPAAALAAALQQLSGVSDWRGRDATWWREWWSRNQASFERLPIEKEQR